MKFTIDKKVTLFIVSMIVILATVLGGYFVSNQARLLSLELDERASVLLNNLSLNMEYPVLVRDEEAIGQLVKGVLAQKDIVFCRIEGETGELLYQDGASTDTSTKVFSSAIITSRIVGEEEAMILGAPKETREEIGKVYLGVSLARQNQKIRDVRKTMLVVIIAVTVLSSIGAYLLLKYILGTPISILVEATNRISEGNLDYLIPTKSRDELGALANSFNRMTQSLLDAQQQLIRKEKLSVLGQLAGIVGHEIRNPLGVINNAVYFLKTLMPDADAIVKEYLDIIKQEIDNSLRIITDLMDFARTRPSHKEQVAIAAPINQGIGKCLIPENIAIAVDIPETLPTLLVDPAQMEQVFQNLVANAVQAMPEGGALRVAARRVQGSPAFAKSFGAASGRKAQGGDESLQPSTSDHGPDKDFIEITVSDTGGGISPENMKKIFQPLYTTKTKGIGLGLVVCRNLVEANGGKITVESHLGSGTIFTVELPIVKRVS